MTTEITRARGEPANGAATTTLVLIRHGQTLHNVARRLAGWTDSPLSEVGLAQVGLVAAAVVERYRLDAIYSSPLRRAGDTALAIGRAAGIQPTLLDDLKELHFGDLENLTEAEAAARYPGIWAASQVLEDRTFAWPGGESRLAFYTRLRRAFERILAAHRGGVAAVVSHGGVLGAYLAGELDGRPELWRKYLLRNCSITEVAVRGGAAVVTCLDDHSYLGEYAADPLRDSLTRSRAGRAGGEGEARHPG